MIWFRVRRCWEWTSSAGAMQALRWFVPQGLIARHIVAGSAGGAPVKSATATTATTAATAMTATIDRRTLREGLRIGAMAEPALVREVIALFLSDAPKLVQSIRDGVSTGDQKSLLRAAHTLKSSAGMVAATDLAGVAASTEAHARASRTDEITALLPRLDFLLGAAIRELSDIRAELAAVQDGTDKQ